MYGGERQGFPRTKSPALHAFFMGAAYVSWESDALDTKGTKADLGRDDLPAAGDGVEAGACAMRGRGKDGDGGEILCV
jgi:hypothetical protein